MGEYLLSRQDNILSIDIPSNVTAIPQFFAQGMSSLESVILPEGLMAIGDNAFAGCSSLTDMAIPAATTTVGKNLFAGCTSLKNLSFLDSNEALSIGDNLCPDSPLEYVRIGRNLEWNNSFYGDYSPFSDKQSQRTAWITDTPTELQNYLFYNCGALENVYVGDNITHIGKRAFSGCQSLKKFQYGKRLQSINRPLQGVASTTDETPCFWCQRSKLCDAVLIKR